jgi:hypothetical protein
MIGDQAFSYTPALANIVLPEGVTEIGTGAFLMFRRTVHPPSQFVEIHPYPKPSRDAHSSRLLLFRECLQMETAAFENNYNLSDVYVLGTANKCAKALSPTTGF